MRRAIHFQETSSKASDFLHELSDPDLLSFPGMSSEVKHQLREAQISRIEKNISVLRAKQADFNRKMEDYVSNLRRLIGSLHRGVERKSVSTPSGGTVVRCTQCESEKRFTNLQILFARESVETLNSPTECYVCDDGVLKKGVFQCSECGGESLLIRSR